MLTTAIFYSLIVMLSFGIVNVISKELAEKFGVLRAIVLRNIFVVGLLAVTIWILKVPFSLQPLDLAVGILIAFISYLGFLFFMLAVKHGKVGIVVPVSSAQIIVASVVGFLFLGDSFNLLKIATVLIVFAGIILASVNFKDFRNSHLFSINSGVPYALLAALIWGISFPLFKIPSEHMGGLFYGLVVEIVVLVSAFLQILLTRKSDQTTYSMRAFITRPTMRLTLVVIVATVCCALGTVFLNFAYQTGQISIVAAIFGADSIVSLVAAAILYREVLSKQQYIGAILVVLGILLPIFSIL